MFKIFISYRRKSSAFTLLLANELSVRLDADIFVDFDSIDAPDFEQSILGHLRESDIFLLMVTEHTFASRIHNDRDWVRKEIRTALELKIPIILVCENGLYPPADLPDDIREIRGKQGIEFYPQYFYAAVTRLVKFLEKATPIQSKQRATIDQTLPVPQAEIEQVNINDSDISEQNAQETLKDAISAYDENDYAQALFLFEALEDIGYQSRLVSIESTVAEIKRLHAQEEAKRLAAIDYEEIAIFARSQRTLPQALIAFEKWMQSHTDFVSELDTENLHQKLQTFKSQKQISSPKPSRAVVNKPPSKSTQTPKPRSSSPSKKAKSSKKALPFYMRLPEMLVTSIGLFGLDAFLLNDLQWSWVLNTQQFFMDYWLLWWIIIIGAFCWGMFWSVVYGDTRVENDGVNSIIGLLFLSIPSIATIFLFSDGLMPLLLIGTISIFYVFVPILFPE